MNVACLSITISVRNSWTGVLIPEDDWGGREDEKAHGWKKFAGRIRVGAGGKLNPPANAERCKGGHSFNP